MRVVGRKQEKEKKKENLAEGSEVEDDNGRELLVIPFGALYFQRQRKKKKSLRRRKAPFPVNGERSRRKKKVSGEESKKKRRNEVNIGYIRALASLKLLDCIRMVSHHVVLSRALLKERHPKQEIPVRPVANCETG